MNNAQNQIDLSNYKDNFLIDDIKRKKNIDLSIVITTFKGSKRLSHLLLSICKSTVIPNEIIIVGTSNKDFENLDNFLNVLNIKFKISKKADQVYQRNLGFKSIKSKYVLQSDDDIKFSENCIEILFTEITKRTNTILCPLIIDENGRRADIRTINHYNNNFFLRLIFSFLNNFKEVKGGSLLNSGRPVPDVSDNDNREWLNSSLCFSINSFKSYEYFDNKGKAFYEDVFTSHNFFMKGYKLLKIDSAKIIHGVKPPLSFNEHLKSLANQYKIVNKFKKSKILFLFDVVIFSIVFLIYK